MAGKFSPELEALKFLGKNSLSVLKYGLGPMTAAAIAYLMSANKENTDV
jgi:hypothetical protein